MNPGTLSSQWPGHEELVGSMLTKISEANRTPFAVMVVVVIGAILSITAYVNTTLLGIHWVVMVSVLIPPVFTEWFAFYQSRRFGTLDPRSLFWDTVEDACITKCFVILLVAQGSAFSPLWFILASNIAAHARGAHLPYLEWYQGGAYAVLIAYFLWVASPADAAVTLLLGAVALWAIKVVRSMQSAMISAEVQRIETRKMLREVRVETERQSLSDAVENGLAREMRQMLHHIESIPEPPQSLKEMVAQTSDHFASLREIVDTLRAEEVPEDGVVTEVEATEIEAELETVIRAEYEERIIRLREFKDVVFFAFLGLLLVLIYQIEAVQEALKVPPVVLCSVVIVSVGGTWIPFLTLRRLGALSPVQLMLDRVEASLVFGSGLALIYFSESATSIFWFVIVAQLLNIHRAVFLRQFFVLLHATGYVALTIAFWMAGKGSDAVMTLVVGGTALWVLHAGLTSHVNKLRLGAESNVMLREVEEAHVRGLRRQVARDLHDGVAADLVVLVMQGRSLQQLPQDLIQRMEIAGLILKAQAGLEELRNVVWGLSCDGVISWNEMVKRVRQKATELTRGMCELHFEADEDGVELTLETALSLIRVAQEAIRNALNYANPGQIGVRVQGQGKIILEVWDDGPGFPSDLVVTRGLKNLHERASELDGSFEFWNDKGAHVRWSVPTSSQGVAAVK